MQELRRRCNKLRPRVHCCMISCFRRRLLFYCSCCRWGEQDIAIPVAGTLPARQQSPLWGLSPRPYAYEAHALPAELRRQLIIFLKLQAIGVSVGFNIFHDTRTLHNVSEPQCGKVWQKELAGRRGKLRPHVGRAQIAQPYLAFAARCCVTEVAGSGGERDITVAPGGTSPA